MSSESLFRLGFVLGSLDCIQLNSLDRMTRSAIALRFHAGRHWRAPRHRSALRSGQVRVTMSTVQSHGHRGQSFASWRFGVFALSDRTALLEQRYEKACGGRGGDAGFSGGLEVSFLTRRRKGAKAQRRKGNIHENPEPGGSSEARGCVSFRFSAHRAWAR